MAYCCDKEVPGLSMEPKCHYHPWKYSFCIGALVTNYLLCLSLQQTGFAIYASWKYVKVVCYEVSYVYTALIEIYYRLEVVQFFWTTRYIKHTYYN